MRRDALAARRMFMQTLRNPPKRPGGYHCTCSFCSRRASLLPPVCGALPPCRPRACCGRSRNAHIPDLAPQVGQNRMALCALATSLGRASHRFSSADLGALIRCTCHPQQANSFARQENVGDSLPARVSPSLSGGFYQHDNTQLLALFLPSTTRPHAPWLLVRLEKDVQQSVTFQ